MSAGDGAATGNIVLHVDADSFFCQVERLRHPELQGVPLAVQQHQDIIAADYAAKAAGVRKHMAPSQARALLAQVGGRVVQVFCEEGARVSYRPYREASGALLRLLRRFVNARVVEKASIDEAYVLCAPPRNAAAAAGRPPSPWDMSAGVALAASIRQAASAELGLALSVGVAPNKLLAKLSSRAAKPDGVFALESSAAVERLLAATPVERLPGMGGRVAAELRRLGATSAVGLRQWSAAQLCRHVPLSQRVAAQLEEWAWGRDAAPVLDRGPPQSLQAQISLTPAPLRMHPSHGNAVSAAGGPPGTLQPLPACGCDTLERMQLLVRAMTGDLLGRVLLDRHVEDRWPGRLGLTITAVTPPGGGAAALKTKGESCAFPTPALLEDKAPPGGAGGAAFAGAAGLGERSFAAGDTLTEAVVSAAMGLAQRILVTCDPHQLITQVHMTVTAFTPFAASASGNIRSYLLAPAAATAANSRAHAPDAPPLGAPAAPATERPPAAPVALPAPTHPPVGPAMRQQPRRLEAAAAAHRSSGGAVEAAACRPLAIAGGAADRPPQAAVLTDLITRIACPDCSAEEAAATLEQLLRAHGAVPRLQL